MCANNHHISGNLVSEKNEKNSRKLKESICHLHISANVVSPVLEKGAPIALPLNNDDDDNDSHFVDVGDPIMG